MKRILYLGNKLSGFGFTPTGVEFLGGLLETQGFKLTYGGAKRNKLSRLGDMLFKVTQVKKYDVILVDVYSTLAFYYSVCVCVLARWLNKPYIPILRGGNLPDRLQKSPWLTRQIIIPAYKSVSVSRYLQQVFQPLREIEFIPNFIQIARYPYKQRDRFLPRLLWVRSLHQIYNPELAVRIVNQLKSDYPDILLTMVGPDKDGSRQRIITLAKQLGVERHVVLTGRLSKPEWIALAADHDIFINTTNYDNMPVSVVEAMALGLPVISTSVGGIPFLITNNEQGILVDVNDLNGFCEGISKLINNPGIANQLTQTARAAVLDFDEANILPKWKALLS